MRKIFKNKARIWLIISVLIISIAIGVFNAAKSDVTFIENIVGIVITPVQKAFTDLTSNVSGFFGYFSNKKELHNTIDELKKENLNLEQKVIEAEISQLENEQLRNLLELKKNNTEFELEGAEVIGRNPSNWYNTLTINKGANEGIALNQPVITVGNSLIGRISEVGTTWSKVTLLTDPDHAAGAQVLRSDEYGICEGDSSFSAEGNCRLSFVSKNANIIVGDTVVTSGLGGIYPKGLTIGKIQKIRPDIQGISQYAVVKPEADFKNIKAVLVIQNVFN